MAMQQKDLTKGSAVQILNEISIEPMLVLVNQRPKRR